MENFFSYCIATVAIISIILSTIWVVVVIKGKNGLKSKFILPAVLCSLWLIGLFMHIVRQNTIGIVSASANIFIWLFNFVFYFLMYRREKKVKEEIDEKEKLANSNKEDIIYVDFVEIN